MLHKTNVQTSSFPFCFSPLIFFFLPSSSLLFPGRLISALDSDTTYNVKSQKFEDKCSCKNLSLLITMSIVVARWFSFEKFTYIVYTASLIKGNIQLSLISKCFFAEMVYSFCAQDVGMFVELFYLVSKKPYSKIVSVFLSLKLETCGVYVEGSNVVSVGGL